MLRAKIVINQNNIKTGFFFRQERCTTDYKIIGNDKTWLLT